MYGRNGRSCERSKRYAFKVEVLVTVAVAAAETATVVVVVVANFVETEVTGVLVVKIAHS